MEIRLISQGKNQPPQLDLKVPIFNYAEVEKLTFALIEGGMQSGEPSVIMVATDPKLGSSVMMQTSLDKLISATTALITMAETRFGWKQTEGAVTLMPMDVKARKALLESIKKELEEWDET